MPDPTPGQVAYETWCVTYYPSGAARKAVPWTVCSPDYRHAWEAAAAAAVALQAREDDND